MRKTIIIICVVFALFSGAGFVVSYHIDNIYWQTLILNMSSALIQLVLGMVIVNLYLDKDSKKRVATAFLSSAGNRIAAYHNMFLELLWNEFGQKRWGEILDSYIESECMPMSISAEDQQKFYTVIKDNYDDIKHVLYLAGEQADEMSKTGLLNFDENIHSYVWAAKDTAKKIPKPRY